MTLNTSKSKQMIITLRDQVAVYEPVLIDGKEIEMVSAFKPLGVMVDDKLNTHGHTSSIIERSQAKHYALLPWKRYGISSPGLCNYYKNIWTLRGLANLVLSANPSQCRQS